MYHYMVRHVNFNDFHELNNAYNLPESSKKKLFCTVIYYYLYEDEFFFSPAKGKKASFYFYFFVWFPGWVFVHTHKMIFVMCDCSETRL